MQAVNQLVFSVRLIKSRSTQHEPGQVPSRNRGKSPGENLGQDLSKNQSKNMGQNSKVGCQQTNVVELSRDCGHLRRYSVR